jgi:hypothetical protein
MCHSLSKDCFARLSTGVILFGEIHGGSERQLPMSKNTFRAKLSFAPTETFLKEIKQVPNF